MGKMFELLKEGLEEAIEFHKGNVKLRAKELFIPDAPKNYRAKDIKELRARLEITQQELATWLNVSLNTVQAWEQGTRKPSHSSLRLLEMFDKDFSFIKRILENKKDEKHSRSCSSHSPHIPPQSRLIAKSKH
jgi:putative transcriptional regulator